MTSQVRRLAVAGCLAGVDPHVFADVTAVPEASLAHGAAERLLSSVNSKVCDEIRSLAEAFTAEGADERLLSGVNAHVPLQVSLVAKRSVTFRTDKRRFVRRRVEDGISVYMFDPVVAVVAVGIGEIRRPVLGV